MNYQLSVSPQAEEVINDTFRRYQDFGESGGIDFLSDLDDKLEMILKNPFMYQVRFGEVRTAQLKKYPYTVVYRVVAQEVQIVNFVHASSNRKNW